VSSPLRLLVLGGALVVVGTLAVVTKASPPSRDARAGCTVDRRTMTAPGCVVVRQDTAAVADPEAGLWGALDAVSDERHLRLTGRGDPNATASGAPQTNKAFRRLTVEDGDDYYGERAELGHNDYRHGENEGRQTLGTFALYREGERKITFFSQRYGPAFPYEGEGWQTILQMKQTQPYAGNGPVDGAPALELQLQDRRVRLYSFWSEKWSIAAPPKGRWIRYALDVTYSQHPAKGRVQVFVDSNADRDFLDRRETSPVLRMRTLAYVTDQGIGAIPVGKPIPSHLRIGIYHDSAYGTATIDVDNVQVLRRASDRRTEGRLQ
jgi:Polysaccharide lyase